MKKDSYANLSNEELLKKQKFFKSAYTGITIIAIVTTLISVGLSITNYFKDGKFPFFNLIPIFLLVVVLMPNFINKKLIDEEIKKRKL